MARGNGLHQSQRFNHTKSMSRYKCKPSRRAEKKSSWEGTVCPCGGAKERETMLCPECVAHFTKDRPSLMDYEDGKLPLEYRRSTAIILCSLARKRTQPNQRGLPLEIQVA